MSDNVHSMATRLAYQEYCDAVTSGGFSCKDIMTFNEFQTTWKDLTDAYDTMRENREIAEDLGICLPEVEFELEPRQTAEIIQFPGASK